MIQSIYSLIIRCLLAGWYADELTYSKPRDDFWRILFMIFCAGITFFLIPISTYISCRFISDYFIQGFVFSFFILALLCGIIGHIKIWYPISYGLKELINGYSDEAISKSGYIQIHNLIKNCEILKDDATFLGMGFGILLPGAEPLFRFFLEWLFKNVFECNFGGCVPTGCIYIFMIIPLYVVIFSQYRFFSVLSSELKYIVAIKSRLER